VLTAPVLVAVVLVVVVFATAPVPVLAGIVVVVVAPVVVATVPVLAGIVVVVVAPVVMAPMVVASTAVVVVMVMVGLFVFAVDAGVRVEPASRWRLRLEERPSEGADLCVVEAHRGGESVAEPFPQVVVPGGSGSRRSWADADEPPGAGPAVLPRV
jgi:hypothetical protein